MTTILRTILGFTLLFFLGFYLLVPRCSWGQDSGLKPYNSRDRLETQKRDAAFFQPAEYTAHPTSTFVELRVAEGINRFDGIPLTHRSYNGGLVGPTIRVLPGAKLKIRLSNNLLPETAVHAATAPHGFNTTNLHTHGLHVSPLKPADDVFLEIEPGETFDFEFDIPSTHPAGTFWYHAHKHGSTALQLASGMAGALIVEGGLDHAPHVKDAKEKIMVFQQFVYRAGEKDFHIDPNDVYFGTGEIKDAINGIRTPTLTIRPGEIQRWRMIHAGIAEAMVLRLPGVEFYEIAVDGLATGSIRPTPEIVLYPGYRRDILVKAPIDPGTYYMSTQIADSRDSLRKRTTLESDVLKLVITGEPCAMTLPTADELRQFAAFPNDRVPDDASLKNIRDIRLDNNSQGQFLVNDREFSPDFVAIRPVVGTAEQWNIKAENGFHPFHVHVNPFAVWIPDSPNPRWEWRDTLFVRDGETVPIRMWFETFSGKTVMHCHNLEHEDKGMMQAIEIIEEPALITSVPTRTTSLLVLHLGIPCEHCATQLRQLAQYIDEFAQLGISIQAFSDNLPDVSSLEAMKQQMGITFPMLLDANRDLFRRYGCVNSQGKLLHGVFLVDAEGDILWKSIGPEPEMDIEKILRIARQFTNTR